ncbi:MAG: phosphoadenylyl-sulfate reductase [Myxococcales bacterium]|nr:phosphoadenylyl-sulfate reductase [Myxococcales bacterium]
MLPDLENATPTETLKWGFEQFGDRIALSTAFGPTGLVLMHLAAQVRPGVKVFFLDTRYHFDETLQMIDRVRARLDVDLEVLTPELTVAEQARQHGDALYVINPDRCCAIRKVEPTRRMLSGLDAWVAGLRRDQGSTRAQVPVVERRKVDGRPLVKLNPLARWTHKDVWRHVFAHDLPYNPLHDDGYASIGCWPCTAATPDQSDERSGRWAGSSKTECGLHTLL